MKKNVDKALKNLINHLFTLLSLSDREKFHTGFIAYLLNHSKSLMSEMFKIKEVELLECIAEKWSADLVIGENGIEKKVEVKGFAEVKFKTGIHSSGGYKNQMEKYAKDFPNSKDHRILIGLFDDFKVAKNGGVKYDFIPITKFFPNPGRDKIIRNTFADKRVSSLYELWIEYLTNLNVIIEYVEKRQMKQCYEGFKEYLEKIKLKGIFERYRFGLFLENFRNNATDGFLSGVETYIRNTHGNALLDFRWNHSKGMKYGIQWQSRRIKLFIATKINDVKRNNILKSIKDLAEKNGITNNSHIKLNREGKFRSFTIDSHDIFDDLNEYLERMREFVVFIKSVEVQQHLDSY